MHSIYNINTQNKYLMMAKYKDVDSDLTAFEKFEQEMKSIIFGVLFVMLKDEEDSLASQIFLNIADGFQTLTLTFNSSINFPWKNDTFVSYFIFMLQLLQIAYWCMMLTWISYLVIFYFFILIICLVILDIIYIAYSFSIKKFTIVWPLYVLRSTCSLFVTVLFMPLIDLFTSMVQCDYEDGTWVHYAFSDVTCWKGMHILHATIALIVTFVFILICLIVSLTFFESKNEPDDPSAKINSRAEVIQTCYKIICVVLTTFFIQDEYRWLNTVVMTAGAIILFEKSFNERPYYNETMNLVCDIINAIFLWSCVMLCLVMLLEDTSFSGGVQLFFIGSPIVAFIIYCWGDRRKKLLMKNIAQFDSGEEWYQKVRYYMGLIHYKDTSRAAAIELKGFIYDHEESCDKHDCPLRLYKQNIVGMIKEKKRKVGRNLGNENNNLLWGYANKLFQAGLSKFPNTTLMRIAYAFFLKEKMGNKNMAISELFHAEKSLPPFDEQFVIYRYRKLMEEETSEVQGEGGNNGAQSANLDVVTVIAYDNHLRQCKEQIERAGHLHMEFWIELQQRRPDLAKLSKTGSKINTTIYEVEEHWTRLQKINPNNPKALRMYGDFLSEILNDKEGGQELISRAKDNVASRTAAVPNFYENANSGSNAADMWITTSGLDGSPCVLASGDQNKLGEIIQLNMGMCRTFGYTKNEMLGKKIDVLMPTIYSRLHDSNIKNSLLKAEEGANGDEKQGKDEDRSSGGRFVLGRHKSGYLVPMWIETRIFFLGSQGSLLGATFRPEKKNHMVCYLLIDSNQDIVSVSSLCVNVLKITNSILRSHKIPTNVLAPNLFEPKFSSQYRTKEGGILEFYLPEPEKRKERRESRLGKAMNAIFRDEKGATPTAREKEEEKDDVEVEEIIKPKIKASKDLINLNCHLTDVQFSSESNPSGYIVRLEQIIDRHMELEGFKMPEFTKWPEFQIVFDPIKYRFACAWSKDDAQKEKEFLLQRYKSFGAFWRQGSSVKGNEFGGEGDKDNEVSTMEAEEMFKLRHKPTSIDIAIKERKNYGEGIKTKRLQNGVWVEVNELNKMKLKELEDQIKSDEEKRNGPEKELMSADAVRESLKSRKGLIAVIKDKSDPPSIVKVKITGYIIVLILLAMATIDFSITTTNYDDVTENIKLIRLSYRRITLIMKISYYLNKAILANKANPSQMVVATNYTAFMGDCKYRIDQSLSELYLVQNNITLAKISTSQKQSTLLNDKMVALEFKDSADSYNPNVISKKKSYYTLTEAVLQMTSGTFTVLNLADSAYLLSNDDVEFILYNSYKDIYTKIMDSSNYYVKDLHSRTDSKNVMIIILFIVALAILTISLIVLFPLISNVGKIRAQVLSLFLDIPLSDVKGLAKRCEKFLSSNNEDRNPDIIESTDSQGKDVLMEEEEGEGGAGGQANQEAPRNDRSARKRRFVNDKSSNTKFFIRYIAGMLILAAFYIINFAMSRIYFIRIGECSDEMQATVMIQPLDTTVLGIVHSMVATKKILSLTEQETYNRLVNVELAALQKASHDVHYFHLRNTDKYSPVYANAYDKIMINNVCQAAADLGFTFDCDEYISGISKEGMQSVMVQYVEAIREVLRIYQEIQNNNAINEAEKIKQRKELLNNTKVIYMEEIETIANEIMEQSFAYLLDAMITSFNDNLLYEITRRVIMFIVLLLLIILAFITMWTPFINKLSTEIWRTKCMLTIIPKEVIAQMKSVQKFLNDPNIFTAKGEA